MRNEYPRMNWRREKFQLLNGKWSFKKDPKNIGLQEEWNINFPVDSETIIVPFSYQSELSGVDDKVYSEIIWYSKKVSIDIGNIEINFGAIDYMSDIYINGQHYLTHEGGETSFKVEYESLKEQEITITIRVFDPEFNEEIQRGKQNWNGESHSIWYTSTSGIWQPVWIDYVGDVKIVDIKYKSNITSGIQNINVEISNTNKNLYLITEVMYKEQIIYSSRCEMLTNTSSINLDMYNRQIFKTNFHGEQNSVCWSPENPILFDVKYTLQVDEEVIDELYSYFGFREISVEDGQVYLNGRPYHFKLILDQGYWRDGLLTAPSDEHYVNDIKISKELGFNGCRKHQKVEDPRFLYWADKLGYLVWGEVSSIPIFSNKAVERSQKQWFEIINRDYNNPSIVAWVPLNESWGVPFIRDDEQQQAHSLALYYQLKSLDDTRLVITNDGWEQTITDICAIHNYRHGNIDDIQMKQDFSNSFKDKESILATTPSSRKIYANGYTHREETPIMITEFGGIAYKHGNTDEWGYTSVKTPEILEEEYARLIKAICDMNAVNGYCYTQLYDVEQEVNGLLTYDREVKCSINKIKKINDNAFKKY